MTKPILLLIALILMLGTAAPAQPATQPSTAPSTPERGGGGGRGEMLIQRFRDVTADLNLTDEQKKKVQDILEQTREEIRGFARSFAISTRPSGSRSSAR